MGRAATGLVRIVLHARRSTVHCPRGQVYSLCASLCASLWIACVFAVGNSRANRPTGYTQDLPTGAVAKRSRTHAGFATSSTYPQPSILLILLYVEQEKREERVEKRAKTRA